MLSRDQTVLFFFFNDTATTEIYTLSLHDALPIYRFAEGLLKTVFHYGPIAFNEPTNYEARANLMWASSLAINDLIEYGKDSNWAVHAMEHELSAYFDITHGVGLGILTDRKSTRLNSSHANISYAVFCLKK